ncbi:hypothetical protein C2G38_2201709 [Gigaspora rosea]|uniref:Uncharacterized protein n=1 Tax=Gigaspora rosea TaxID=44941 RepID=A0A397UX11_9GLOM|nr:hypothetical protein C2G38_2201709 [Gigaspora rosea]
MFPKKRKADTQDKASFSNTARQSQSLSYPVQQSQISVQQSCSKSRELRPIQSDPTIPIIQPVPSTPTIQPNPIIQPIPIPSTPFIQPVPTILSVQPHQSYFQPIPPIHQYQYQSSPIPDLNTSLNFLELHINNNRSAILVALRTHFGLLHNDLLNDGIDAMMTVIFPNTSRRSRSVTPILSRSSSAENLKFSAESFKFLALDDWSSPLASVEPRDDYEFELHRDGLNLPLAYYENRRFPFVPRCSHDVPASFTKHGKPITSTKLCDDYAAYKEFPKWVAELFQNELHALFIRCRNLDDAKSNAIIKKFIKILVSEIGDQDFDDAASKFWAKSYEINDLFANLTADDVQKEWHQFLVNIDIEAIHGKSNSSNDFELLLLNVVRVGIWVVNFYDPKDAQSLFYNLNNDLYTVNLNVLTVSGWNVTTSIDLSRYTFHGNKGANFK